MEWVSRTIIQLLLSVNELRDVQWSWNNTEQGQNYHEHYNVQVVKFSTLLTCPPIILQAHGF